MAVSGRKLSDLSDSLSRGSAEDVENVCNSCLTIGQQVDAQKYCVDCEEYLCKTCSDYHLRTKALKNHNFVDEDNAGKQHTTQDSEACTEKCPEHKQEVIKYFCSQHEVFACHDCIIMYHRTCEIDYIPDKCTNIADSEEYRRTVHRLDLKLQELEEITETTKVRDQEIDKCYHNLLQEIINFRKEINDYLDRLQQKIQNEADKKKTEDKQITKRILDGCNRLSSDIKKMSSSLQVNETLGKYGQLYITVKQAQSLLRSDDIKAEDGLERTAWKYIFERNSALLKMLSKQDAFGKLKSALKTPKRKMKTFQKLIKQGDINVRTKSDEKEFCIRGCAVLSSNKLVLADYDNYRLKLVNIHTKSVVEEISLDSKPWGVAVLSQDQIAVTMPNKREVDIMAYDDRLSTVHTISVTGECRGITHHHGQLYVNCRDPLCVIILDKQGNVQNKITLKTEMFSIPQYLMVSKDSKLLYISDSNEQCVVSITLKGEVKSMYKHTDLCRPHGMLMLDDGSLLVCSLNGSIYRISGDLKQGQRVIDGLRDPYSICYNHHLHEVYIGGFLCDKMTVLIPE